MLGEGAPGRSFEAAVEVVEQLGSEILLEARLGATRITVARVRPRRRLLQATACACRCRRAGCISSILKPKSRSPAIRDLSHPLI